MKTLIPAIFFVLVIFVLVGAAGWAAHAEQDKKTQAWLDWIASDPQIDWAFSYKPRGIVVSDGLICENDVCEPPGDSTCENDTCILLGCINTWSDACDELYTRMEAALKEAPGILCLGYGTGRSCVIIKDAFGGQ